MITIFCAFFTLLTCVSGVTVLTQSPLITASKGQTAKLDCNLGTITSYAGCQDVDHILLHYSHSSVICAKVVTQKPPILTEQKGRSVTMDCNIEKDESYYVSWYKQIPNAAPQFVLRYYRSHSSPDKYGDGFTSSHFTSKAQSNIDYQLIISNVDVDDSAVYYCGTWDNTDKENVSQ
ncbi:Immunoglobulin light [Labeo rohita]|nr:Immunoglobulin light [Labeo rohita]